MNFNYLYFIPFIAFGVSYILTPWARKISVNCGMVAVPNHRKIHKGLIPYGGGIAIFLGFLASFLLFRQTGFQATGYIIGAFIIITLGIYDDLKGMKALPKFAFQAIAATIAIYFGLQINMDVILRGHLADWSFLSIPLTFLWIVGITNAINLIDGLDGLAAGVVTISAFTIATVSWVNGSHVVTLLSLSLGMASLGFLPHNFRSQVFMGDAGSQFLGYSLAIFSIMGSTKLAAAFSLFVPVMILAIPIFDTLFAIVRRIVTKRPIYEGDKKHLHHRLLELGFSPVQTVVFIYILSFLFGGLAILSSMVKARYGYYIFGGSLIFILLGSLYLVYLHQLNGKIKNNK